MLTVGLFNFYSRCCKIVTSKPLLMWHNHENHGGGGIETVIANYSLHFASKKIRLWPCLWPQGGWKLLHKPHTPVSWHTLPLFSPDWGRNVSEASALTLVNMRVQRYYENEDIYSPTLSLECPTAKTTLFHLTSRQREPWQPNTEMRTTKDGDRGRPSRARMQHLIPL